MRLPRQRSNSRSEWPVVWFAGNEDDQAARYAFEAMMDMRKIAVGTLEAAPARRPSAVLISEVLLGELPEGIGDRRPALQGRSRITYRVSSEAFADGIHRTIRRPSGAPLPRSWPPLLVGEPQGESDLQRLLRTDMGDRDGEQRDRSLQRVVG